MSRPRRNELSRRTLIAGAAAFTLLPAPAGGQPGGFRIIRAREGKAHLLGADRDATPVWGFDGTVPGPVLRVKRGEEVKIRLVNDLPADTAVHWHGVRLANGMDGVPGLTQPAVAPGGSFDYRFTPPDAGTFWYRASLRSSQNRGLHGLLIVDEAEPLRFDRDVALVLDAWPLGADGRMEKDAAPHFTVNGLPTLDIRIFNNQRIRLRLLNATDAHFITVRIDRHPVTVIAIDGQPAEPFLARDVRVTLSPGNRVDLSIDAVLQSSDGPSPIMLQHEGTDIPIARLVYGPSASARLTTWPEMKPLPPNPLPARMDFRGALRIDLPLDGNSHDNSMPAKPLFSVKRGRTVMLAIVNRAAHPSVLHVHGHHVRLLDALDDGWKPFWLDTILAVPQQTTRVAFVVDNPGKWLLHSRMIGAEGGTIAWFEVA